MDQYQFRTSSQVAFNGQTLRQDFIATTDALSGIDLYIVGFNPPYQDTVAITLRAGDCSTLGAPLVSDSRLITNPDGRLPTHFNLGHLTVTPGASYTIEVTAPTLALGISLWGSNTYPGGSLCSNPSAEMTFATYDGGPDVPAGCPADPRVGCISSTKATLQLSDSDDDSRDTLQWKYLKPTGPIALGDFGFPSDLGGGYQVCLYDDSAPAVGFFLEAENRGPCTELPCWSTLADKKLSYKNKDGSFAGVTTVSIKPGETTKGKIQLKASGDGLPLPGPAADEQYFLAETAVALQLVSFDTGDCFESVFEASEVSTNTARRFTGKAK